MFDNKTPSLPPRAAILGCAGLDISAVEAAFFAEADPLGFILFRRNCDEPDQIRALVTALRRAVGRDDAPVLIDQEGGRVARLRPPHWPEHPPARRIGELAALHMDAGCEAAWINARLLAFMLTDLGITVNCAPVCDVPVPSAHDVIGDRAFAEAPELVARLAEASCEGLLAGGVLPVIKHIPGHGRAAADSHHELPVVTASPDELELSDFLPFRRLASQPLGMVAHVVFPAWDAHRPASTSAAVLAKVVRQGLGFQGLLISDDLSMGALSGTLGERTRAVRAAGCDIALHCNGRLEEMAQVVDAAGRMDAAGQIRWARAQALMHPPEPLDVEKLRDRFQFLLSDATLGADGDPTEAWAG